MALTGVQDLEFASVIVQKLNIILITSPELADFRKRLKSLETRVSSSPVARPCAESVRSKMARLYLSRYIGRGAIMLFLSFLYAFLPKLTNTHQICSVYCAGISASSLLPNLYFLVQS